MKRLFDLTCAAAGIVILSPVFLAIALMIAITMGFPVFFRQVRVGKGQSEFRIFKFRTMVKDAASRGPSFTAGGDPRITKFGKFLRRYKLDELPQLFNVVIGDMSLVGPRPEVPKYVAYYNDNQLRVLGVRPGLTDLASIVYRNEEGILARHEDPERAYVERIMPAKLKLNLSYLEKASFSSDLGLIFKTLTRIFSRR